MKEVRVKRGCLQSPSPKVSTQTCLVFHQKSEEPTAFGAIDFPILSDIWSKDTSHASFFLRKFNLYHRQSELGFTGMLTSEPVVELQQKTQSAGLWDKSLAQEQKACCKDFCLNALWTFEFSHCKDITLLDSLQEIKGNLNNIRIHNNIFYVN